MEQDFDSSELRDERKLMGIAASNGIVLGNVFFISHGDIEVTHYQISDSDIDNEITRLKAALAKTREDVLAVKNEIAGRVGEAEASIFDAHLLVIEDVALIDETIRLLRETKYNVDYCYQMAVKKFIAAFGEIDDAFIRERIADIEDVSRRVINNLLGKENSATYRLSHPKIIASSDFAPSDFALLDKSNILGIVTEKGSQTSHTAIMARSMKVPCIVGLSGLTEKLATNDFVLVDGYSGTLFINPLKETTERYAQVETSHKQMDVLLRTSLPSPNELKSGEKFDIDLNISGLADLDDFSVQNSSGVGLFRTENYFINSGSFPSEEEQYNVYKSVVEKMGGKPVIIRTLDLGGDKNFALLNLSKKEQNPFMGYRAIRFCLDHEDIFMNQLRALLRASAHGSLKIMFPMISAPSELRKAKQFLEAAKTELKTKGLPFDENVKVGMMIEVPSAAIMADIFAEMCDFISVGTNDLTQYMFAVDRVNDKVAYLYEPASPAMVRVLGHIAKAGSEKCPVSVCGELASDPIFAPLLIGLGITHLSMSSSAIPEVKFLLRKITLAEAKELAANLMQIKTARGVRGSLREFYYMKMKDYLKLP